MNALQNNGFKITVIVCFIFTFWFQPSSPFLVKWLTQSKTFTADQVYQDLFPLWSYAQFFLVIGGLFAQYVSFRAVFVFGAILVLTSNLLLLWGDTIGWMRLSELANGASFGTFSIFMAYLYTAFPEPYHQRVTSFTRAATLISTTVSASVGQLIVNSTNSALIPLYLSIAFGIVNCLNSLFLPPPLAAILQQPEDQESRSLSPSASESNLQIQETPSLSPQIREKEIEENVRGNTPLIAKEAPQSILSRHWKVFRDNYNTPLVIWSAWAGVCFAIHMLVLTYWQSVMRDINPNVNYNGYVTTTAYGLAAVMALVPTRIEDHLNKIADWLMIVLPIIYGILLLCLSLETVIYLAYVWLILYHSSFEFMFAVSSVQIARRTGKSKQFGIVFSLSMLVALVVQNVLQVIVGEQVLSYTPELQYRFYSFTFFTLAGMCLTGKIVVILRKRMGN